MSEEKPVRQVGVKIVKADDSGETPTVFVESQKPIEKSDKSEQLSMVNAVNASEWITHPIDMRGLKELVDNSTILPQCIRAYKSNIAGFGISVGYCEITRKKPQRCRRNGMRWRESSTCSIWTACRRKSSRM